jgi:hypothetical protein
MAVLNFVIDGLAGKSISELQNVDVDFEPPEDAGVSTFILRILVAGPNGDRVQRFTIGPDNDPELPNLPTRKLDPNSNVLLVSIPQDRLLEEKSKLKGADKITKFAFLFSSNGTSARPKEQVQFIDSIFYGAMPVYVLLEPLTCNLR